MPGTTRARRGAALSAAVAAILVGAVLSLGLWLLEDAADKVRAGAFEATRTIKDEWRRTRVAFVVRRDERPFQFWLRVVSDFIGGALCIGGPVLLVRNWDRRRERERKTWLEFFEPEAVPGSPRVPAQAPAAPRQPLLDRIVIGVLGALVALVVLAAIYALWEQS